MLELGVGVVGGVGVGVEVGVGVGVGTVGRLWLECRQVGLGVGVDDDAERRKDPSQPRVVLVSAHGR